MAAAALLLLLALLVPQGTIASESEGEESAGRKEVEIDLGAQVLKAWEGDNLVRTVSISSGRQPFDTPTGTFSVFAKYRAEDMAGPDPDLPGGRYFTPDVWWVMYFAPGGYAMHGVYWHNNFGTPMSHGCVGMPESFAEWLYGWAPIGTPVIVHR